MENKDEVNLSNQVLGSFPECGLLPPPLALKVTPSDPDTLFYESAMLDTPQKNIARWMEAAAKEIASLEKNGT
jgi:hypothetical protein